MGRRLAVRLYWMWRNVREYAQWVEFGSIAGQLITLERDLVVAK